MSQRLEDGTPIDVIIDTWQDALTVTRASSVLLGSAVDEAHIRGGVLGRIDGPAHDTRRRVMNRLVSREGHTRLRDSVFLPALRDALAHVRARSGADGVAHADLMTLLIECSVSLAAAIVGLGTPAGERRALLLQIEDVLSRIAVEEASARETGGSSPDALRLAARLRERFTEDFFRPELRRRRLIVAEIAAGTSTPDALPNDLLSLIATGVDSGWHEEAVAVKECLGLLRGASRPTAGFICAALEQLELWFAGHPEDVARRTDLQFLAGAVQETLRLRTPLAAVEEGEAESAHAVVYQSRPRILTADVILSDGRMLPAGVHVAVDARAASRDPIVYGPDAAQYNPRRRVPHGVYPWGLAFGTGPHMCLGIPIAMGIDGSDGTIAHALRALFEARVSVDWETKRVPLPQRPFAFGRAFRSRTFPVQITSSE